MTFALFQIRRNGSEFIIGAISRPPKPAPPPRLSNAEVVCYLLKQGSLQTGYLRASRHWDSRG